MSRLHSIFSWRIASPQQRSDWFWKFAVAEIIAHRRYLIEEGLHHGDDQPHDFELKAIDSFCDTVIQGEKDDDEAVEAAVHLIYSLANATRGRVPAALLYNHGPGSRVRAALLKGAWLDGKSGSILALNGGSLTSIISYFQEVERADLMEPEEIETLSSLSETVRIFRGAKMKDSVKSTSFALSWSRDYPTARRFALHGHGSGEGVVLTAEIPRDAILALWEASGAEPEVVVNPRRLRRVQIAERIDKAEEMAAWGIAA
ncbi:hypothetical protein WMC41_11815 [Shinella yambaruensis]|uniref:hypothetical protein n=1 Tax=Shinella yambaruensis TaxID=415996 RepID=UPI003D79E649